MRYVVDACNLMFCDRRLEETLDEQGFQASRTLLATMLARFAAAEDVQQIVAVFDGSEKGAHRPRRHSEAQGRVLLVYANPRSNADRFIIELVEDAQRPGEITVVTGDKFIIRHALRASAHHLDCRGFLRMLHGVERRRPRNEEPRGKFSGQLSPREMDEWMQYFGFEDEE